MKRREAVQKITFLLGGTISAPLMAGIMGEKLNFGPSLDLSAEQEALLADVADTIIPTTGTPGAKAAGADKFITRVMRDCFEMADQKKFYSGLEKIDAQSKEVYGKGFSALDATQKNDIVKRTTVSDKPFFLQMKGLTVTGYFTSEIGATQALDYLPIPGRFDGSWPMPKGQKSWAL
ncbi:gluconate 2-dehydrogenase subunit 3 family protein [Dyadobacter fanqingshengii]|uniref:Gluconate 2-dehydrogenase subunit 3 family protein n=1 Tax=Dyadobacter fanqingshengii TaxID=2906443 RepID=A0A9X1PAE8_9BACT|nr:gluconate 2-dehydrogenase subunit 3 family protein [Dyadobacter fanqingshengii]MCF0040013.1 gluconate 2-dehydrogenase subunit 3 family protein [Dyadobacter fanqingshengii]USJ38235.1 gluconate 2-dehydrogenase subunit 3 family protein [Dyadobacter fanqingshengii]